MVEVKTGNVPPEAVNQAAGYILFVEGSGPDAIDPRALIRLLSDTAVSVKALGPSYHVKSAAQALHPHHPNYYFLIDRDHHDENEVIHAWQNFPDPSTHNLLIWKKRELENYFLDLNYLAKSTFATRCNPEKLKDRLVKVATERVFLDLANHTIEKLRENQKRKWIEEFTNPAEFPSANEAITRLKNCQPLKDRPAEISRQLEEASVERIFRELEQEYLDGSTRPEDGRGKWAQRMCGKKLLSQLINDCFTVKDADGNQIRGREAVTLVAEELLKRDLAEQPDDFQKLHELIALRTVP